MTTTTTTAAPTFSLSRADIPCAAERKLAFYWQLGAALRELGCDTDTDTVRNTYWPESYLKDVSVDEDARGYWTKHATNKLRCVVGDYGSKKQFPEPNKGFDVEKIAKYLKEARDGRVRDALYKESKTSKKEANQATLKVVAMDFKFDGDIDKYDSLQHGYAYLKGGKITATEHGFKLDLASMDEMTTRKALAALFNAGVLSAK